MQNLPNFTVCLSVYQNSKPDEFLVAFNSIINQTIPPNEIILVIDGPISKELASVIKSVQQNESLKIIELPENKGLGNALRIGVENSHNDLIARMDSDDIALSNRFELQLNHFLQHPNTDVLGGQVTEFIGTPDHIIGKRIVPLTNKDIYSYMKKRCAMNHPSVMLRKKAVMDAGNYQDWFLNEDYYLWIRMMSNKCEFANLDQVLVNLRVSEGLYERRGGWSYFKSEAGIQVLLHKYHFISRFREIYNIVLRFIIQILLPNKIRAFIYQNVLRDHS